MSDSLTTMSAEELHRRVETLRTEGLRLRIQKKTGQLANTASITKNRREVARCLQKLTNKK